MGHHLLADASSTAQPASVRSPPKRPRRARRNGNRIVVTDDWPENVPVTPAEIAAVAAFCADLLVEVLKIKD